MGNIIIGWILIGVVETIIIYYLEKEDLPLFHLIIGIIVWPITLGVLFYYFLIEVTDRVIIFKFSKKKK